MNKLYKLGCSLLITSTFLSSTIFNGIAHAAEPNVDKLFEDSFKSVKKVVSIATKNGVKPYYFKCEDSLDFGPSTTKNTVNAVKSDLQTAIYDSRKLIDELPKSFLNYKQTFSSILDNFQHPIFERTVAVIESNKENPKQSEVIWGRILIDDLDSIYKAPYSTALDELQGAILTEAEQLVLFAEEIRVEASFNAAKSAIEEIKAIPDEFSSEDILSFVKSLEDRLIPLDKKGILDKIINMPSVEVTPDDLDLKLPAAIPEGYTLYVTFEWIKDYCNNKVTISDLKSSYLSSNVIGDGFKDTITLPLYYNKTTETSLPVQSNYLIYVVNNSTSLVEYVSKNPITLTLGVESSSLDNNPYSAESTIKINSGATHTGYITHEILAKDKDRNIKHDVLVVAEDTPADIAKKLKKSTDSIASEYLPNTSSTLKDDEFTIKSSESSKIVQKIY